MNTRKLLPAVAGFFIASAAIAAEQQLANPSPSEFADRESSTTMPIPTDEGRHINLTIAFEPTPSNAVQVAFGRDLNGSETLEPEETEVIVGCDCGFPVVCVESSGSCSVVGSTATPTIYTFTLKQPKDVSSRCNLAKVTTHNLADTNLTVTADFYTKGTTLILR